MAPAALEASKILRDPSQFQWYVIPLFILILYAYSTEVKRKNWNAFFAGLAFWGMDLFNEIWNSLVFHFTNYAPVWGAPGETAYLILIGLNIEITFMFALAGLFMSNLLPEDKNLKILGIPNRWFTAISGSIFACLVEILLNSIGVLTWDYPWWSAQAPWLLFLIGYLPFFVVAIWVHDMDTVKKKVITVGSIIGFDILCIIIFGLLHWI